MNLRKIGRDVPKQRPKDAEFEIDGRISGNCRGLKIDFRGFETYCMSSKRVSFYFNALSGCYNSQQTVSRMCTNMSGL